jgi:hypothetical protein
VFQGDGWIYFLAFADPFGGTGLWNMLCRASFVIPQQQRSTTMLYRANGFIGHNVLTQDGALCSIQDFYFDDQTWTLRYFVLDSERWSSKQRALISLEAISGFDNQLGEFTVNVTEEQIKTSPGFNAEINLARYQEQLHHHYGWNPPETLNEVQGRNFQLGSLSEVRGFVVQAMDDESGRLDDFLLDFEDSNQAHIIYLIVDSRKWAPGGIVLIDRAMVENFSWNERKVFVSMTKDEVRKAPVYDSNMMFTEECITQASNYYQHLAPHKKLQGMPHQGNVLGQQPMA